jgi:DNA-binding LacI/PurR family transcriptional regulator
VTDSTPPTLEAVAARAGVSRSTVSRVVNASPKVTPEVVAIVTAAIAELGYVPNRAARMLASRRTQAIALVIPENTALFFSDPFFATVIQGVAMRLGRTEYTLSLVIASEDDPDKTRRYLQGGNLDGALILSHHRNDRSYLSLAGELPVVFGGRPMSNEGDNLYVIDVDNVGAAQVGVRHLLSSGRRRIAHIAGRTDMAAGIDRQQGWRDALAAAGLEADLLEVGDFTVTGGMAAMERLLDRAPDLDAVFAASDQMASGATTVLRERGIAVPDQVAVVGVDDNAYALSSIPHLTTVAQPSVEFGAAMAETLVRLIEGEDVERLTLMPTRLVVRDSA